MSRNAPTTLKWKPESYNKLSFAQNEATLRILKVLKIKKNAEILDVGCGEGKISAKLSKTVNRGSVTGIDKSTEMITFAKRTYNKDSHSNLKFLIKDAQKLTFDKEFDLVFSSFALQWFPDKNIFFTKAHEALREGGQICIIAPLGISPELEFSTKKTTEKSEWNHFFHNFHPNWHFISGNSLISLVMNSGFEISHSSTYMLQISFPTLSDFEEYVLLWYPYLNPLDDNLKNIFFSQVISDYCISLPPKKDGTILMNIPVISLIGSKVIL